MKLLRISLLIWLVFPSLSLAAPESGSLRVRISDAFESRTSQTNYFLRTIANRFVSVPAERFDSVEIVPGGTYTYDSDSQELTLVESDSPAPRATTGHDALAILVNFSDREVSCSTSKVSKILREAKKNVSTWFETSSFSAEGFDFDRDANGVSDVVEVTLAQASGSGCDYQDWSDAADARAALQGVSVSDYTHVLYVLPSEVSCGWGGLGEFGCGSDCRAWVAQCAGKSIYAHELGHNLGLDHASTDTDNDGVADDEYGDTSCPMGTASVSYRHFNVPHKFQLGWYDSSFVTGITEDGFVELAAGEFPLVEDSESLRAVRVFIDPTAPLLGRYYFSFRSKLDKYSKALDTEYRNRLNIHRTRDATAKTLFLSSLGVDESFVDDRGRRVTFSDFSDGKATVWVSPDGTEQPTYAIRATVQEQNGKSLSESLLGKLRLTVKKVSSKAKQRFDSNDQGIMAGTVTRGTYKIGLKGAKKKLRKVTKSQTLTIAEDTTDLIFVVKKR